MNQVMIIKQGRTEINISEQDDCILIVRRVFNPTRQDLCATTPMIVSKEAFVAMFDAMAEAVTTNNQK